MRLLRVAAAIITASQNLWTATGASLQPGEDEHVDLASQHAASHSHGRKRVMRNENPGKHLMRKPLLGADSTRMRTRSNGSAEVIAELKGLRNSIDRHVSSGKIGPANVSEAKLIQTGHNPPTWQAFAVTLKRRPQRLTGFVNALKEQEPWVMPHLSYIFAVDGMELSKDQTARDVLVENGYVSLANLKQSLKESGGAVSWWDLSPGAIGCYISHAKVWEQIVDRDLDYGLIFEDDMRHFRSDFEKIVRTDYLENKQRSEKSGDIVYLQHCDRSAYWDRGSPTPPEGVSETHVLDSDLIVPCTAGYLISNNAARQMLYNAFPIKVQLDRAMAGSAVEGLKRLRYEPALAQVGNVSASSDVQESSTSLTWLLNYLGFKIGDMFGLYDNITDVAGNATAEKLTEIMSVSSDTDT